MNKQAKPPRIGLMLGDTSGIGPEIIVKLLHNSEVIQGTKPIVIGDNQVFEQAKKYTGLEVQLPVIETMQEVSEDASPCLLNVPVEGLGGIPVGKVSKDSGVAVYKTLKLCLDLIKNNEIDGLVFGPFNKESLQLGGCPYHSEFLMFMDYFGVEKVHGEINILDELWATRVTSHIAIRDVSQYIRKQRIVETIQFLHRELEKFGVFSPKIAVSALNPHGGENGLFGDEEQMEIIPAIDAVKNMGIDCIGPYPCDTIFSRIEKENINGIISMYHDQSQVATKLLGFDRGVTLHGGMDAPIATCAHGTAFDIAGTGKATPGALEAAYRIVSRISRTLAAEE